MVLFSTIVCTLLVFSVSQTQATSSDRVSNFDINTQLMCHVKRGGQVVPEGFIRLPLGGPVRQRDSNGTLRDVWLPQDSRFRLPQGQQIPDADTLRGFLGDDFNQDLTSIVRPARDAPRPCDFLVAIETEGPHGQQRKHISTDEDPIPLLPRTTDRDAIISTSTYQAVSDDPSVPDEVKGPFRDFRVLGNYVELLHGTANIDGGDPFDPSFGWNTNDAVWDIWLNKCPLGTIWAQLPENYFPRYFAQGTCSGKNCSLPRGLFCEEDFSYLTYVTVLRWDCCYNFVDVDGGSKFKSDKKPRWDCGWRKVGIPLLCDCSCECSERFHQPGKK